MRIARFRLKNLTALLMAVIMITSNVYSAFAEEVGRNRSYEEMLEKELRGSDADVENFPNGKMEFIASSMNASESLKSIEIMVVRKGGTEGEARVDFKAVDVTAAYGLDYTIRADGFELFYGNPQTKPLVDAFLNENSSGSALDVIESQNNADTQNIEENIEESQKSIESEIKLEEQAENVASGSALSLGGLRAAKANFTGVASDRMDWKDVVGPSEDEIRSNAFNAIDQWAEDIEGVYGTLLFKPGEYSKKITVDIIDDKLSESDEQIVFLLTNPENCVTGEASRTYLNIQDNDENESVFFTMDTGSVQAYAEDGYATVVVKRITGIHKFAAVNVKTASITAIPNVDYMSVSSEVVFPQGVTEQEIKIPLSEQAGDGSQFEVRLDNEFANIGSQPATVVTIQSGEKLKIEPLMSTAVASFSATSPKTTTLQSGTRGLHVYNATGYTNSYTYSNLDLRTAYQVVVVWKNDEGGRYWEEKDGCGDVTSSGYDKEKYNDIFINGSIMSSRRDSFGQTTETLTLSEGQRKNGSSIKIQTKTGSYNNNSRLEILNVYIVHQNYTIILDNNPKTDNKINIREWYATNPNISSAQLDNTDNVNKYFTYKVRDIYVGSVGFVINGQKMGEGNNQYTFQANSTVSFTPYYQASINADGVYQQGFRIVKGSATKEIQPDNFVLDGNFIDLHKSHIEDKDSANPKITLAPIFKQKTAFVYVEPQTASGYVNGLASTANNANMFKIGQMDTIHLTGTAKTGYFVSGYNVTASGLYENNKIKKEDSSFYKTQFGKNLSNAKTDFSNTSLTKFGSLNSVQQKGISWVSSIPNKVSITPIASYMRVTPYYKVPSIIVRMTPRAIAANKDKGAVYYIDGNFTHQGTADQYIEIHNMEAGKQYTLNSITQDGYQTKWKDFTGDTDGDGALNINEEKVLSDNQVVIDRDTVSGSSYTYFAGKVPTPLIYYSFHSYDENKLVNDLEGNVSILRRPVFSTKATKVPLEGATVTTDTFTDVTDKYGNYSLSSTAFSDGEKRAVTISYNGLDYSLTQSVNAARILTIDEYSTFDIFDAKMYKWENSTTKNVLKVEALENFDNDLSIEFFVGAKDAIGLTATKAVLKVCSRDGATIYTKEATSSGGGNFFSFTFNPSKEKVPTGAYMTVQIFDQNGTGYMVHDLGVVFGRWLGTFDLLTSFSSPVSPVLEFMGKIDGYFDFGLSGKTDDYFKFSTEMVDGEEVELKTMEFGFSKSFNKSDVDAKKKQLDQLKDAAKNGSQKEKGSLAKDATASDGSNEKSNEVSTSYSMTFSVGLAVIMQRSKEPDHLGEYFFKDIIITATCDATASVSAEVPTPIYINVYITFTASGEANALVSISKQQDAAEAYFDGSGKIDLSSIGFKGSTGGASDYNKQLSFYGSLAVKPTISLSVAAGWTILQVGVRGTVSFDLNFDTMGNNSGSVTLTAEITLKILMFSKSWEVANKTYDMFNSSRMLMADSSWYLYEPVDSMTMMDRSYGHQKGAWNGGSGMLRSMSYSGNNVPENVLLSGVYPYPNASIVDLGGETYLMIFLDDIEGRDMYNKTAVKYSIYSGGVWSEPQPLDDDGTLDDSPTIYKVNDSIVAAAWSSTETPVTALDNAITAANKTDIKCAFFDISSMTFGEVQNVTKKTQLDVYGDSMPQFAYGKNDKGEDVIAAYYIKSEYEATLGTDGLIGDVVNPYSVITCRFYDVNKKEWISTYSDSVKAEIIKNSNGTITDSNFSDYETNMYGQHLLNLAPKVEVVEKLDDYGFWTQAPTINTYNGNQDPLVIESDVISYNNLAIFAYILDLDQKKNTVFDRELYIQLYDFEEDVFAHPIMITNDGFSDSKPGFTRFKNATMLTWVSDGKLQYLDISSLVKYSDNSLYRADTVDNQNVYILNKFAGEDVHLPVVLVDKGDKGVIGDYSIATDGDNYIYVAWTEDGIGYKDGVLPGTEEASLAENQYAERQLYMKKFTFGASSTNEEYYQSNGKWSGHVRITDAAGANYSDPAFAVTSSGDIKMILTKGESMYSNINNTGIVSENINSRQLVSLDISTKDKVSISNATTHSFAENSTGYVGVSLKNEGFVDHNNITVTAVNGSYSSTEIIDSLPSGEERFVEIPLETGDQTGSFDIAIAASSGSNIMDTITITESIEPDIRLNDMTVQLLSRNEALVSLNATNAGNMTGGSTVQFFAEGRNIGSYTLSALSLNEEAAIESYVTIDSSMFRKTDATDGYEEEITITARAEDSEAQANAKRYVTQNELELINKITSLAINDGKTISMRVGGYTLVETAMNLETNLTKVIWESSDESVATVAPNGIVQALRTGSAVITGLVMPGDREIFLSQSSPVAEDIYPFIPDAAIKKVSVPIIVTAQPVTPGPSEPSDNDDDTNDEQSEDDDTSVVQGREIGSTAPTPELVASSVIDASQLEGITDSMLVKALESMDESGTITIVAGSGTKTRFNVDLLLKNADLQYVNYIVGETNVMITRDFFNNHDNYVDISLIDSTNGIEIDVYRDAYIVKQDAGLKVTMPYDLTASNSNSVVVLDQDGKPVILSFADNNIVSFIMDGSGAYTIVSRQKEFDDVKGKWYENAISFLAARDVVFGLSNMEFGAENDISRADFITMLMRMLDMPVTTANTAQFSDVDADTYYSQYILAARSLGIASGVGDNNFNPEERISREDMFVFTARALRYAGILKEDGNHSFIFKDADNISGYAAADINSLASHGIVSGFENMLNPKNPSKRGETAQVLYGIIRMMLE